MSRIRHKDSSFFSYTDRLRPANNLKPVFFSLSLNFAIYQLNLTARTNAFYQFDQERDRVLTNVYSYETNEMSLTLIVK